MNKFYVILMEGATVSPEAVRNKGNIEHIGLRHSIYERVCVEELERCDT
jgi:hypothetical protein